MYSKPIMGEMRALVSKYRWREYIALCAISVKCAALAACGGPLHNVSITSYAVPGASKANTHFIISGDPDVRTDSIEFQAYASRIAKVMRDQGFTIVDDPKTANAFVFVRYGMGNAETRTWQRHETRQDATYANQTLFDAQGRPIGSRQVEVAQETPVIRTYSAQVYPAFLTFATIARVDLEQGKSPPPEQWKVIAYTEGPRPDLDLKVLVMIEATRDYIGKQTGKEIVEQVDEESALEATDPNAGQPDG